MISKPALLVFIAGMVIQTVCAAGARSKVSGRHSIIMAFDFYLSTALNWRKGKAQLDEWVTGWVVESSALSFFTTSNGKGDGKHVIIDNGAWGRFSRGEDKPPELVIHDVEAVAHELMDFNHPIEFCILPDNVGDWKSTLTNAWMATKYRDDSVTWALVIQDGFKVKEVAEYLDSHNDRLFIGGSDKRMKYDAVAQLGHLSDRIHVGRVTPYRMMLWAWNHPSVSSIDNSTFARIGMKNAYGGDRAAECVRRLSNLKKQQNLAGW